MPGTLTKDQRSTLEKITLKAREAAEVAARAALDNLAVHEERPRTHLDEDQRRLRNRLRARGRALGDRLDPGGNQSIDQLAESTAYAHWHRLLFTRFLAENHVLHTSAEHGSVPVTLEECDELAPELFPDGGASDGFDLACRFAAETLPGIFRLDDPVLDLRLAPNHEVQLRRLLDELPAEIFRTDDALGWTYQFWQAKRKDEVNKSGVKIGARELPAVTQLFTEDYMVEFLLHNSLGAWWAAKEPGRPGPSHNTEAEARQAASLPPKDGLPGIDWTYLRFVKEPGHLAPEHAGAGRPYSFDSGQDGPAPFVNPLAEIQVTSNSLPHWQQGETWIFVTWRLADSLPTEKLHAWQEEKDSWRAHHPKPWDVATTRDYHERFTQRIEDWLDAGHGACILRSPAVRRIVTDALAFFDGKRYELGDWVVMPNHVHVLFRPLGKHRLPDILHSWKSFTAKAINKVLGHIGSVWQEDYWDRLIRNERHLDAVQCYIAENPAKAGLGEGEWSGRFTQRSGGVPPLPKESRRPAPISNDPINEIPSQVKPGRDAPNPLRPAAGTFEGWPKRTAEIRFLDPCMGSGHFLVFALPILARLRMEEDGLTAAEAIAAVLRDNLHGLEIDERCTQIAAFNVALTAWRLGGYQPLPTMHLACCGLAPHASKQEWMELADRAADFAPVPPERDLFGAEHNLFTAPLRAGMERLYDLFSQAPVLGSLIDPRAIGGDLLTADFLQIQPILDLALARETNESRRELAVTAQGLTKAAEILAGRFTLVATNVPYLARGKQSDMLKRHCETHYPEAKNDLANCFLERCLTFVERGRPAPDDGPRRPDSRRPVSYGTVQVVMPQNRLFLGSYRKQREQLLREVSWNFLVRLGMAAFDIMDWWAFNVILLTLSNAKAERDFSFSGLDASGPHGIEEKAKALRVADVSRAIQSAQLENPDARVVLDGFGEGALLSGLADYGKGSTTGDRPRFLRNYWELPFLKECNRFWLDSPSSAGPWSGRQTVTTKPLDDAGLQEQFGCRIHGQEVWGRKGVAVSKMRSLQPFLYSGEVFDDNIGIIAPRDPEVVSSLWSFVESGHYSREIRKIDQKVNVTAATLVKVPFDLAHWQSVAAERYPNGLPKPYSDDPTQWLFDGYPFQRSRAVSARMSGRDAPAPLHVAVARLIGYRWPRQTGSEFPDCPALDPDGLEPDADADGIVCLSAINRELPAAARLRGLLAVAFGADWTSGTERDLLAATGAKQTNLEDWLQCAFFEQHCKLFQNRPFIWHLWDGRTDGFHALVNYHRLDRANLEKLTYSYLGDWIRQQDADAKADKPGAAERLGAARALETELVAILEGEPPYDLFIRWKPLAEQPLGWQPDINDGVRLNIRPFMQARDLGKKGAGILRAKPNIKWDKDRGTEPRRDKSDYPWFWHLEEPPLACPGGPEFTGKRWNNVHLTLARKRAAR